MTFLLYTFIMFLFFLLLSHINIFYQLIKTDHMDWIEDSYIATHSTGISDRDGIWDPGAKADLGLSKFSRLIFVNKVSYPDQQTSIHRVNGEQEVTTLMPISQQCL